MRTGQCSRVITFEGERVRSERLVIWQELIESEQCMSATKYTLELFGIHQTWNTYVFIILATSRTLLLREVIQRQSDG